MMRNGYNNCSCCCYLRHYETSEAVHKGKPFSVALSLSLTAMLLLRIPNQICFLKEPHGWYSVMGTLLGAGCLP